MEDQKELSPKQEREFNVIIDTCDRQFSIYNSALAVATDDKRLTPEELKTICLTCEYVLKTLFPKIRYKVQPYIDHETEHAGYTVEIWWKGGVYRDAIAEFSLAEYGIDVVEG